MKLRLLLTGLVGLLLEAITAPCAAMDTTRLVNTWEVAFEGGSALNDASRMSGSYSNMVQVSLQHQFRAGEFGPAMPQKYLPSVGLTLTYCDFSHTPVVKALTMPDGTRQRLSGHFGHFASAAINFSQYQHIRGRWTVRSMVENGAAFAFNPYSNAHRRHATTIGGRFQVYFSTGVYWGRTLSAPGRAGASWEVSAGPQFTHISNSGTYRPNSGVNNLSIALRLRHSAWQRPPWTGHEGLGMDTFQRYIYYTLSAGAGLHSEGQRGKRPDEGGTTAYVQPCLTAGAMMRHTPHAATGLGLDYFGATGHAGQQPKPYLGLSMKNEAFIRQFTINVDVGVYVNGAHPRGNSAQGTRIYEKIGMKYYPSYDRRRRWQPYAGYYIKGNGFTAEQFELAAGIALRTQRERGFLLTRLERKWARLRP